MTTTRHQAVEPFELGLLLLALQNRPQQVVFAESQDMLHRGIIANSVVSGSFRMFNVIVGNAIAGENTEQPLSGLFLSLDARGHVIVHPQQPMVTKRWEHLQQRALRAFIPNKYFEAR